MSSEKAPIVVGLLFALGAVGGFVLSREVSPIVKDTIVAHAGSEGASGGGAVEMNGRTRTGAAQNGGRSGSGSSGDGEEKDGAGGGPGHETSRQAARHPGQDRDVAADAGSADKTAGAGKRSDASSSKEGQGHSGSSSEAESDRTTPIPCRHADLVGMEAVSFLAGNTVDGTRGENQEAQITYFAPRGLIAHFHADTMVVGSWDMHSTTLCEPDPHSPSSSMCGTIQVRKCLDVDKADFHIGDLRTQAGEWLPVLRGNTQGFPQYFPYLDQPRPEVAGSRSGLSRIAMQERNRVDLFRQKHVYQLRNKDGLERDQVVFFEKSGRRFQFHRPTVEEAANGISVDLSWWKRIDNDLCEGKSDDDRKMLCRAMSTKADSIKLMSSSHDSDAEITAVSDVRSVLEVD